MYCRSKHAGVGWFCRLARTGNRWEMGETTTPPGEKKYFWENDRKMNYPDINLELLLLFLELPNSSKWRVGVVALIVLTPSHDHCQQYWPWCHRPFHLVTSSKKTKTHCHGSQYVPWQRCLCQRFCERKSCGSTSALNEILSIFGPRENVWRPRTQIIVN